MTGRKEEKKKGENGREEGKKRGGRGNRKCRWFSVTVTPL